MKISKSVFLVLLFAGILMSCAKENEEDPQLTYNDFESSLTADMDYQTIVKTFGDPMKDIGSGIHIYVYILDDSTEMWIGYTDQILYAKHVDQDQNTLHTLIGSE